MRDGQCHGKGVFQYADGDRCGLAATGRRSAGGGVTHTVAACAVQV